MGISMGCSTSADFSEIEKDHVAQSGATTPDRSEAPDKVKRTYLNYLDTLQCFSETETVNSTRGSTPTVYTILLADHHVDSMYLAETGVSRETKAAAAELLQRCH